MAYRRGAAKKSRAKAKAPPAVTPSDGFIEVELSGPMPAAKRSGRKVARVPVVEQVDVSGFFGEQPIVTDVSLGGVFVETARILEVGDPVQLAFTDGASKLRVTGRVRWVSPFGGLKDARAGMGIELVGATDPQRARIFELLRHGTSRPGGQKRAG